METNKIIMDKLVDAVNGMLDMKTKSTIWVEYSGYTLQEQIDIWIKNGCNIISVTPLEYKNQDKSNGENFHSDIRVVKAVIVYEDPD